MVKTINEQEFHRLCEEVAAGETPAVLQGTSVGAEGTGPLTESESTSRLLKALFIRLCQHLGLDPEMQASELGDGDGFALAQTLEEHMEPEFLYSPVIDAVLNRRR